jgi:hypothetical protein
MAVSGILASIDREIAILEQARSLLGSGPAAASRKNAGRPKKALVAANSVNKPVLKKRKKRKLTPEGRKRIAEAVKRRWEKQRKAAAAAAK